MSKGARPFRARWMSVGAAVLASALLYWVLLRTSGLDFAGLWKAWRNANLPLVCGVLIFSLFVHIVLGADKLWRVLKSMGFDLPWTLVLKIRLGAGPLRALMPVDMGEALNIAFFKQYSKIPLGDASGACLFDRGLNFGGSAFWLTAGLVMLPMETQVAASHALGIAIAGALYCVFVFATPIHGAVVGLAIKLHPKVGRFAQGVLSPFKDCPAESKLFLMGYGIVFQARPLIVCYFLFAALGVQPPLDVFIAFASLAVFAGHIPTAAGIGPREAALMVLFQGLAPAGTIFAVGAAMSLLVHVIPMIAGLPWLPWFLRGLSGAESGQNP
ncbi:hypothetical protein SAMN02745216_02328 [Desulfatibacillum alkenivorans DSM 16219]|uniref:Lysylphosphatidylglycerol synthase TM region n=1 Tax=Desulfatibacillum alkenivorans DSM 16219 TaxID=1121393 RepID=A0A1M6MDM6_9BACT|nr:lysylphosphatidylglycerol synthase domain-containing protein [Desulfatibacillum alkenivorans]SHJ81568.1 hypothetical protein SAMN02745216_02328 [Desulfatibacillum alkenivorans DSM 16219]